MDPDCYKIEVLHYLNPHLIWVEVVNHDAKNPNEFHFEQIGVFGILPQDTSINFDSGELTVSRCEEWVPAATTWLSKAFDAGEELWFQPSYIDNRTSIFDNNIHKYGEIIIKQGKKTRYLSEFLVKTGFALDDDSLFFEALTDGTLKTKLDTDTTKKVIANIEKCYTKKNINKKDWDQSIDQQTRVSKTAIKLETELTVKNLEKHNRLTRLVPKEKVMDVLQAKFRDLELCKNIDETPLLRSSDSLRKSKLKTKYKDIPTDTDRDKYSNDLNVNENVKSGRERAKYINNAGKVKQQDMHVTSKERLVDTNGYGKKPAENVTETPRTEQKRSRISKMLRSKVAASEKKMCIAFGPPEVDKKVLLMKELPKLDLLADLDNRPKEEEEENLLQGVRETSGDADSETDLQIANIDVLRKRKENKVSNVPDKASISSNLLNMSNVSLGITPEKSQNNSQSNNSNVSDGELTESWSISSDTNTPEINQTAKSINCITSRTLRRRLELCNRSKRKNSINCISDTSVKDTSSSVEEITPIKKNVEEKSLENSDDDDVSGIIAKINAEYPTPIPVKNDKNAQNLESKVDLKINVNPFQNFQDSVIVDKIVCPVLMVHTKMNTRIQPSTNMADIPFNSHISSVLKSLLVNSPKILQTVSWSTILRGYSIFMISPKNAGKTLGYLPAVCRLISDGDCGIVDSTGPMCIIVCATARSVAEVEKVCKMFLDRHGKVLSCYPGKNELTITTALLNGCDVFISTPSVLVRLMKDIEFGVDLRRLSTFVMDDCERLDEVYGNEIKYFFFKIKEMLKNRANKTLKVQYILASRQWCNFMEPLSKKVPNTVICISDFKECVLYSKVKMAAEFVKSKNKKHSALIFLNGIDKTKRTVIVCASNNEVSDLEKTLNSLGNVVVACNKDMELQDLYDVSVMWNSNKLVLAGPILVCCDSNLAHLNVTDAHHLIHYSLPETYSLFCKRFSVLNDHYPSIFKDKNENIRIKILLDETDLERLPKIYNFIQRCTENIPEVLKDICDNILVEKDRSTAESLIPFCDSLSAIGECPDFWNCKERHLLFKEFDEPQEWLPKTGTITFKMVYYHSPVKYSARLLTNINGTTKTYPQTHYKLHTKMGMYYSKESNKRLHGVPKVGDICAVSIKLNQYMRCQVVKILSYFKGNPKDVLINLIDEQRLRLSRDVYLYHLPSELRDLNTHTIHVRLADIRPKDKDVTYSELAREHLEKITEKDDDIYMRGNIVLTVGNCVYVDALEACQDLTTLNKTIVKSDFREELLGTFAIPNPGHIEKLESFCKKAHISLEKKTDIKNTPIVEKEPPKGQWAHLDKEELSVVSIRLAEDPDKFFVRLHKFASSYTTLINSIQKYVKETDLMPLPNVKIGDIVLARYPDDLKYERARIDEVDDNKFDCFFVDQGEWRIVNKDNVLPIPDQFVTQMPYQAIECRLIGVQPLGTQWTDFSANWFCDCCFGNGNNAIKLLHIKYFKKEPAESTGGSKYAVVMVDTNGEEDIIINKAMIDANLAQENEEIDYVNNFNVNAELDKSNASYTDEEWVDVKKENTTTNLELIPVQSPATTPISIFKPPIRSVPLIGEDDDSDLSDRWDVAGEFKNMLHGVKAMGDIVKNKPEFTPNIVTVKAPPSSALAIKDTKDSSPSDMSSSIEIIKTTCNPAANIDNVDTSLEIAPEDVAIKDNIRSDESSTEMIKPSCIAVDKDKLDSDDLSTPLNTESSNNIKPLQIFKVDETISSSLDPLRKPKLVWRQNKLTVTIKIELIGVKSYEIDIKARSLTFFAEANDTKYGFDIELFGVIDKKKSSHANKGQYILVKLTKSLKINWICLCSNGVKKWVVYDVDAIDATSSEEEECNKVDLSKIIKHDSDSDAESFCDDADFYEKQN